MATDRASELPVLIVNGADSPRSRIGRGLESIGGMTAETLQRISTAVGGVVKSPVVLMAKVGGLASPRAATLPAPPGSSLAERIYHLENQMKSLEEKFSPMTIVTELDLSTPSRKEKPRIVKSLLQEMETDKTLEKRVQMLEDLVNERMDRFEKVLSSIQSRLDHVELNWHENVVGDEHQESLSGEPQYYDAEQQSDNFEALEATEQNFYGERYVPNEATGGSPTFKESRVKETLSIPPTTAEHIEPLQEIDAGKNDDVLNPQVVSTPVYSKEAFSTQPLKSAAPSSEPTESVHRNDVGNLLASSDQQLASTLEELHGSFVSQSSTTAASAKFLEIARAVTAEKNTLAHASPEPQSTSILEEPRKAFPKSPSTTIPTAKSKEHVQDDTIEKSVESPSPPTFEATQKDFMKEPLAAAPNAELAQELATQGFVVIAVASSEPPKASKFVEEPLVVVPSANSEESAQEDMGDESVTITAIGESPNTFAFQNPQEDFMKESLADAPSLRPAHESSSQEDSSTSSDMAFASSKSPTTSKSMEEPSAVALGANSEESTLEDVVDKSDNTIATAKIPLAISLEGPQEESAKEFMTVAPSVEFAQVQATQEDNDVQVASLESQMVDKFVEEPSATIPSADSKESTQGDIADKTMAATELSLVSSLEEPKEGFDKEFVASTPSGAPAQEHGDMAPTCSEIKGASKFEEALVDSPSANFGEHEDKVDANESGTISASVELPSTSTFDDPHEDFEKESLAAIPSAKPVQELEAQEDNSSAFEASKTAMNSKFVKNPSTTIVSAGFEEPTCEDANKDVIVTTATGPSLSTSNSGLQEDFEESLVVVPNAEPIHEPSSQEDSDVTSDKALVSSELQVASKFVEEPSSNKPSANSEELAQEDGAIKNDTVIADVKPPLACSFEEPQEEVEKEFAAMVPDTEHAQELATQEESDMAPASSEFKGASKFVEEPLAIVPRPSFEEPMDKDATNKNVTGNVVAEDLHKEFAKESSVVPPNDGPAHEISSQEDLDATRDMAFASSAPHLTSKFVEKPSPATLSANSKEGVKDKDDIKNDSMSTDADSPLASSFEKPQEDFEKESSAATLSANSEEGIKDKDDVKNDSMSTDADSPLASSFEKPQEDFEKESLAATLSHEPTQGLAMEEDTPTSSESHKVSEFVEETPVVVSSADFEEPTHEDAVDKSVAVTAATMSPLASSFEEPHEDSKEESTTDASSVESTQEVATQEDSDMAPSKPQVASKFADESSATDVPSAKFEEPVYKDTIDRSGSVTATIESPLESSLEEHGEDNTKEPLAAGASAKVLEPTKEDEYGESPIAFAPLEAPSASFLGISKESSGTSVQPKESMQASTVEESNHVAKEVEYKLAKDFQVHHEHVKSSEKEFPRSQSNLAHVGSDESLATEDCDDHLESDQSGEEFFDAEHGSGNFEPWESDEPKPFKKYSVGSDEPSEAMGITSATQKEILEPVSILKPVQESTQEPEQEPGQTLVQDHESTKQAHTQGREQHGHGQQPAQEYEHHEQRPTLEHGQQLAEEHEQETGQPYGKAIAQVSGQEHEREPTQELGDKLEQPSELQLARKLEQEDLSRNSTMALPTSEPQVTSKSEGSHDILVEEPLAALPSTKFEELARADAIDKSGTHDLPLTSTTEEPQIDSVVSPEKSLSSASFDQSGNPKLLENLEQKSLDTPSSSFTPQEALEREPLTTAPTTEIAQEHDTKKSDSMHISLEPQLEGSKEALVNEPVKDIPSSESTKLAQEVGDGQSSPILASLEPQSTPTLEEPQEGLVKEPLADANLASKSMDLQESPTDEPLAVTTSAKLAPESVVDKINAGIVEESPLTPIAEEPQNGSVSFVGEGKHELDEADQKFLEDVKTIAKPIEEAIPRTQSDLTHVKLNPEASEDATKLQSQGSFLAFASTSLDSSKDALVKEPLPPSKLLELFEEENDSGKRGPVLANSPMTSTVEEPQKAPLVAAEPGPLASAKSVPKGHARWRGFARSSSEPQFAYKLEEHRKALAKESSVASTIPSASKLGEEHGLEDFDDTQCLPFRILGEGKPPRKESESKLVEDVKSPAMKSETAPSPYVLQPQPSKIKDKKKKEKKEKTDKKEKTEKTEKKEKKETEKKEKKEKKEMKEMKEKTEKKERKPDAAAEEKERRLSLGVGEMERKSSLRAEEKGSKYSPRADERHKQPFRHLRDRLRHAFSVNKEP